MTMSDSIRMLALMVFLFGLELKIDFTMGKLNLLFLGDHRVNRNCSVIIGPA